MVKSLQCQRLSGFGVKPSVCNGQRNAFVVGRIANYRHRFEVLGRGAQKGNAANVYLLHGLSQGNALLGNGLLKGIEVDNDQINRVKTLLFQLGKMLLCAARENAAMNCWVQCLYTAVEKLREPGKGLRGRDRHSGIGKLGGRAPAGDQLEAGVAQLPCKRREGGLVGHRDQCTLV